MDSPRNAAIPIDHAVAELAAIPLATEASFRLATVSLDPFCKGNTKALWRNAENEVLKCFPAFSVDEIVTMRDQLWFPENRATRE